MVSFEMLWWVGGFSVLGLVIFGVGAALGVWWAVGVVVVLAAAYVAIGRDRGKGWS